MQKVVEKIIMGFTAVAVLLAMLGLILKSSGCTNAGIIVLMIAATAYFLIQLIMYWKNGEASENKSLIWGVIVSFLVALVIFVLGILLMTGKILPNGWFGAVKTLIF